MTKPETSKVPSIAIAHALLLAEMGAPKGEWPNRRAATLRLPKGYSAETTITDESTDAAFTESAVNALTFIAAPYAAVTYAPMTRASLLSGDDSEEECPATLRSFK
jgi:hypothetical protein